MAQERNQFVVKTNVREKSSAVFITRYHREPTTEELTFLLHKIFVNS
jgi:hypothetical protein